MEKLKNFTNTNEMLYKEKKDCCGCGVCAYVCPQNAIEMNLDSCGAYYPSINSEKCTGCNLCIKNCAFHENGRKDIQKAYAAVNRDETQLHISSSGGVFAAVASCFLDHGDAVCGVIMDLEKNEDKIHHCLIIQKDDLVKLQGSKYGQSRMYDIYNKCAELLKANKKILFSGTPCQVNAFKQLFKQYSNQFFTLDLICHGVPGNKIFDDYVKFIEAKTGYRITGFVFRDKKYGWGCNGQYSTINVEREGKEQKMKLECKEISSSSSYYYYFLTGDIYRDSCYECPFATSERVGDLTIGDYWGIEKLNPELLSESCGSFVKENGVSCVLVNTEKGSELIQMTYSYCHFVEVNQSNIKRENSQLNHPVELAEKRTELMALYRMKGYAGIEKKYISDLRQKKIRGIVSKTIPKSIKRLIKR